MTEMARSGNRVLTLTLRIGKLKLCERIIFESRPIETLPLEKRIIKSQSALIDISLSCFYATKTVNQFDIMNDMFTVL